MSDLAPTIHTLLVVALSVPLVAAALLLLLGFIYLWRNA